MALAANPPDDALEESQLEQRPIGDEEMELEEGLAATEQVIQLLDQIISQGKQTLDEKYDEKTYANPFNVTPLPGDATEFIGYGKIRRR